MDDADGGAGSRRGGGARAGAGGSQSAAVGGSGEGGADVDDDDDDLGMMDGAEDDEEEKDARRLFLERRAAREEDAKFPDEVDTSLDTAARVRFARYRGLASWRTSPWHPKENLPAEYARIYQFEQWAALQRHAMREQDARALSHPESVAPVGAYVAITLRVPEAFTHKYGAAGSLEGGSAPPLVVCGVNTYENHLSVLHFSFTLSAPAEEAEVTVKGKQRLFFHCGFRTFSAAPIYSEDTRLADKHKLERYVQPGRQVIASVYAPALHAPAPVIAFLPAHDPAHAALAAAADTIAAATAAAGGGATAAATSASAVAAPAPLQSALAPSALGVPVGYGALMAVDAERIILKKILITGMPFRCARRKAVVRWMFFDPDDVKWFQPIALHTKLGRKGAIRESLGTHGYMKCLFDGPIHQHDTVCMSLYKRSYPKWGTFSYR